MAFLSETKRTLVLGILSMIGLGYWLHTPVPQGFSTSAEFSIRKAHAIGMCQQALTWMAEQMGLTSQIPLLRYFNEIKLTPSQLADNDIEVQDALFDNVPVRIYRPKSVSQNKRPGIMFYHGGGWSLSSIDMCHNLVLMLAKRTNAVVISVAYRLAPEHVYPMPHDDCVTAAKYFIQTAEDFNVDSNRIALCGESAGGNLAATVALHLRDDDFKPRPKLQVLIYPVTQLFDFHLPSMISHESGPLLTRRDWVVFCCTYLTGNSSFHQAFRDNQHISPVARQRLADYVDVRRLPEKYLIHYSLPTYKQHANERLWNEIKGKVLHRYVSPLAAPDLKDLPHAYVMTSEYDILRDEGILYALRLQDAGNQVTHVNWEDGFHAIMSFGQSWPETQKIIDHMISFIVENL